MANNRQITLPGKKTDAAGNPCAGTIKINLDDTTGDRGLSIDQELYKKLVNTFINQGNILRPYEKPFYLIDKQLLQILLSSEKCEGLLLSKCIRPEDGKESIAFTAVDENKKPLNWRTSGQAAQSDDSDIAAGEWIQGFTVEEVRQLFLKKEGLLDEYDFEKLFDALSTK